MSRPLLLRDVLVDDRACDVLVADGHVAALEPAGRAAPRGARVVDGAGGALLPGLHDHHVHLNAMAAARRSLPVGPDAVTGPTGLGVALAQAAARPGTGEGWVRAVGYHEDVAGDLDRHALDAWVPDVPVRVQHRSGALWILNSIAIDAVATHLDDSADVEREADGRFTGRLWRYDQRLAAALPDASRAQRSALTDVAAELFARGVTGVTDATPDLADTALDALTATAPLRVHLLGRTAGSPLPTGMTHGPWKVLLRDHDLPPYDELVSLLRGAGTPRRPVAVHCVSRESLVLTLVALEELGTVPGDRIEHGAVVPPDLAEVLARLGLPVVTQPDFLRTRGETYLRDVDPDDVAHLYPWQGLCDVGVRVAASSDAPYGSADPWQVIASGALRRTTSGTVIGAAERVPPRVALASFLTPPDDPGGAPRTVAVGARADLCLLEAPLDVVLARAVSAPADVRVRLTVVGGRVVHTDGPPTAVLR